MDEQHVIISLDTCGKALSGQGLGDMRSHNVGNPNRQVFADQFRDPSLLAGGCRQKVKALKGVIRIFKLGAGKLPHIISQIDIFGKSLNQPIDL